MRLPCHVLILLLGAGAVLAGCDSHKSVSENLEAVRLKVQVESERADALKTNTVPVPPEYGGSPRQAIAASDEEEDASALGPGGSSQPGAPVYGRLSPAQQQAYSQPAYQPPAETTLPQVPTDTGKERAEDRQ